MTDVSLGRARLLAQGLITCPWATPTEAVAAFGAMQGQDLPGVMASAALRSTRQISDVIEAMNAGRLVRAYPMRETVFLMAAEDAWWVSELINPPMLKAAEKRRGHLELDEAQMDQARELALQTCAQGSSRTQLFEAWTQAGLNPIRGRGYHMAKHLISEGTLVYGPWNGKDQNLIVADNWLSDNTHLDKKFNGERIPAVAELLRRYLLSHGPATLKDFAWWTKLPQRDIKPALTLIVSELETDGERYWRPDLIDEISAHATAIRRARLLPGFDEYVLGYQDRLFAMIPEHHEVLVPGNNGVFGRSLMVDGQLKGVWKRGGRAGHRSLDLVELGPLTKKSTSEVGRAFRAFPFITP